MLSFCSLCASIVSFIVVLLCLLSYRVATYFDDIEKRKKIKKPKNAKQIENYNAKKLWLMRCKWYGRGFCAFECN